jgi:hypothetical protein
MNTAGPVIIRFSQVKMVLFMLSEKTQFKIASIPKATNHLSNGVLPISNFPLTDPTNHLKNINKTINRELGLKRMKSVIQRLYSLTGNNSVMVNIIQSDHLTFEMEVRVKEIEKVSSNIKAADHFGSKAKMIPCSTISPIHKNLNDIGIFGRRHLIVSAELCNMDMIGFGNR